MNKNIINVLATFTLVITTSVLGSLAYYYSSETEVSVSDMQALVLEAEGDEEMFEEQDEISLVEEIIIATSSLFVEEPEDQEIEEPDYTEIAKNEALKQVQLQAEIQKEKEVAKTAAQETAVAIQQRLAVLVEEAAAEKALEEAKAAELAAAEAKKLAAAEKAAKKKKSRKSRAS